MTELSLAERFPHGLGGVRIHAVGAGGHGISAALRLARERGARVSGCDAADSPMARALASQGVPIAIGHDAGHADDADLVVVSPAVTFLQPDLPELVVVRARDVPVLKWQALLGYLMARSIGASVAGLHGKGSTTALLRSLAIARGLDPTVEVGETVIEWGSNAPLRPRH